MDAAERLARQFHEVYERRAPEFGYKTRTDTRQFDPLSQNGKLMIAVCREILADKLPPEIERAINALRLEVAPEIVDSIRQLIVDAWTRPC